jgi:hypothetical protein
MQKINFNKSIKDKEKKILEYYKIKTYLDNSIQEKPVIKKRTKKNNLKQIQNNIQSTDEVKLTKTAKLPITENIKPKIVEMD